MSGSRQQEVRDLFQRVTELDREAARRLLDEARAGSPQVVAEVESLLQAQPLGEDLFGSTLSMFESPPPDEPDLSAGEMILHYRLLEIVGEGASGTVWKAEDSQLRRTVALKILRAPHRNDMGMLSRFRREARVLAHLTHPGIGAIHAVEEWQGFPVLALEFVPGLTLSQRLQDGPLPVPEALSYGLRLAEAVNNAHEAGVIHRDLKPSNIKLTPDGGIKVLDFGLAKGFGPGIEVTESRSMLGSFQGTMRGTVLGTASYMSPEQTRGEPLDAVSDVWSFGCVLYEMLTGRQAFPGETLSDTFAAIIGQEPDWSLLPADTPPRVRRLLAWCLRKDVHRRLASLGDVAGELILAGDPLRDGRLPGAIGPLPGAPAPGSGRARSAARLLTGALLGMGAALAWWLVTGGGAVESLPLMPHRLLSLPLPAAVPAVPGEGPGLAFAVADGDSFLYRSLDESGASLYLRSLSQRVPRRIPGTEGVVDATFADTEGWVALQSRGAWWKVPTAGGVPGRVVASTGPGADWVGGRLVFAPTARSGLDLIGTDGRGRRFLTRLDPTRGEISHRWPAFTPDGRHVVFCISRLQDAAFAESELALVALDGGEVKRLGVTGSRPQVTRGSFVIFARGGRLLAMHLDGETGILSGPEREVAENIAGEPHTGAAHYAVSRDDTAVYIPGPSVTPGVKLRRMEEQGLARQHTVGLGTLRHAAISSSGRIAGVSSSPAARLLLSGSRPSDLSPVQDVVGVAGRPVWSPDGQLVAVSKEGPEGTTLILVPATGGAPVQTLLPPGPERRPEAFTPDGSSLIFSERSETTGLDLMTLALDGAAGPEALRATPFDESEARPSPDGHWLAYVSHESGNAEVYLQQMDGSLERLQVSHQGGCCPVWSASGRRLWFLHGTEVMTVSLSAGDPVSLSQATTLASLPDGQMLDAAAVAGQLWFVQAEPALEAGGLNFITGLGKQGIAP